MSDNVQNGAPYFLAAGMQSEMNRCLGQSFSSSAMLTSTDTPFLFQEQNQNHTFYLNFEPRTKRGRKKKNNQLSCSTSSLKKQPRDVPQTVPDAIGGGSAADKTTMNNFIAGCPVNGAISANFDPDIFVYRVKQQVCPKCNKHFRSRQQLLQHSLVHSGERKHHCQYCDRSFKQLSHLQQHHRIHTGEKPYQCPLEYCDQAFPQLSNLQHHLRKHEKYESCQNVCFVCQQTFCSREALQNHITKKHHFSERNGDGGATFTSQQQHFNSHPIHIHSEEIPISATYREVGTFPQQTQAFAALNAGQPKSDNSFCQNSYETEYPEYNTYRSHLRIPIKMAPATTTEFNDVTNRANFEERYAAAKQTANEILEHIAEMDRQTANQVRENNGRGEQLTNYRQAEGHLTNQRQDENTVNQEYLSCYLGFKNDETGSSSDASTENSKESDTGSLKKKDAYAMNYAMHKYVGTKFNNDLESNKDALTAQNNPVEGLNRPTVISKARKRKIANPKHVILQHVPILDDSNDDDVLEPTMASFNTSDSV